MTNEPVYDTILRNLRAKLSFHEAEAAKLTAAVEAIGALLNEPVVMNGNPLARGFDRNVIRKRLLSVKIRYPVAASYAHPGAGRANFVRQYVVGFLGQHRMIEHWMKSTGIASINNPYLTREQQADACVHCGIDESQMRLNASILYEEIMKHGEAGIDYLPYEGDPA